MAEKIYDAFGKVPANISQSRKVRYWHEGAMVLIVSLMITMPSLLALAWMIPGNDLIPYNRALKATVQGFFYFITGGGSFKASVLPIFEDIRIGNTMGIVSRILISFCMSLWISGFLTYKALKPRSNITHLSGTRVLEGEEALEECKRRSISKKEAESDPFNLYLHPKLRLNKKFWARHMLMYGSVGSGKSVVLKYLLNQVINEKKDARCFIYDVKGDFTSIFRKPVILSPFDKRSYVWWISQDVRTLAQAADFCQGVIPPGEGNSLYWTNAAREVLMGCIVELQITKPREWAWNDLSDRLLRDADQLANAFKTYYPQGLTYLEGGKDNVTVQGVLSNLSSSVDFVHKLARAWPKLPEKRKFSITDWTKDGYDGRKHVIVQSGPDPDLTQKYIALLINLASTTIISPSLPDNESGRFLGFFIDEMSSVGKLNIESLVNKGRSKGVVCVFAVQDLDQVRKIYGDLETNALTAMVGCHLVFNVQAGETRKRIAEFIGKKKVAWFSHGETASAAHEEGKSLISESQLTNDLGFKKGKKYGEAGFGIRALIQSQGDVLILDWPGANYETVRVGQEEAKWVYSDTTLDMLPKSAQAPKPEVKFVDEEEAMWMQDMIAENFPIVVTNSAEEVAKKIKVAGLLSENKKRKVDLDLNLDDPFGLVEMTAEEEEEESGEGTEEETEVDVVQGRTINQDFLKSLLDKEKQRKL